MRRSRSVPDRLEEAKVSQANPMDVRPEVTKGATEPQRTVYQQASVRRSFLPASFSDEDQPSSTSSWSQEDSESWNQYEGEPLNTGYDESSRLEESQTQHRLVDAQQESLSDLLEAQVEEQKRRKNAEACIRAMADVLCMSADALNLPWSKLLSTSTSAAPPPPPPPPPQQQQQQLNHSSQPVPSATSTKDLPRPSTKQRRSVFSQEHLASKYPATPWSLTELGHKSANMDKFGSSLDAASLRRSPKSVVPSRTLPRKGSLKRVSSLNLENNNSDGASSPKLKRNSVSFSNLEIREYSVALSDHPSCSYGPPIQLGWEFRDAESVAVEKYEQSREPRRRQSEMILSHNMRQYLLLKSRYSSEDLLKAEAESNRVKRERFITDMFLPASKLDETVEEVVGCIKGAFCGNFD